MVRMGIDIYTKKQILEEVEKGTSYKVIREKFNLKHSSNICQIIKNKDKVLRRFQNLDTPFNRKTLKTTKYENIDTGLKQFISNCEQNGLQINTETLREKALEIARQSGQYEFRASNGYLTNFSNRNSIGLIPPDSFNSEDSNLDMENLGEKFQDLISNIDPRDIFCVDEFGLYWRLFPNKNQKNPDKFCKLGQDSDERLTIFTGVSMIGEKLPLVIISYDEKPLNSKEISKLNVSYYSDKNSWINQEIFKQIMNNLNEQMRQENRFIIIFLDSCSAHCQNLNYSNLSLIFIGEDSNQPLNIGVFKCLKAYYRMKLCRKMYALGESKLDQNSVKLFNVIEMLSYSWDNEIKPGIIVDCFTQCGFYQAKGINDSEIISDNNVSIQSDLENIALSFKKFYPDISMNDYIDIDENLVTSELYDDEECSIESIEENSQEKKSKKDAEKVQAINAIDTLKLYFAKNFTDDLKDILANLNDLENKIYEHTLNQS
ncbi:unnamed protein product [Brachionus calyciflorus]|uniref:HTH CENPB-type domain-containing protein n=1 Tax=Brachionus calyciflorus TaxID=104777 RepID=A0A813X699_9BILA|nr:unnamed protein product [Brachionus calyciflorus]